MSRNPYHNEDNAQPALQFSVFAYFDILGYSEMIKSAFEPNETLAELHRALTSGRRWLDGLALPLEFQQTFKKDRYALKAFTDNIAIGWPISDDAESELADAIDRLIDFQFHMAVRGFFLRGAIVIGDAFLDEIVVFGDALLAAHDAEAKLARDPRIILTDSAIAASREHLKYYNNQRMAPLVRRVLRDADGQWFLNYLEAVLYTEQFNDRPLYDELIGHKTVIEEKLSQFQPKPAVWAKYAWVANYHNYFCDVHSNVFDETYKISIGFSPRAPELILE